MKFTLKSIIVVLIMLISFPETRACTIFCGKDKYGQIWAGNNEDNIFSFHNYINVFPKTIDSKYGYFTLSYHTPENGENFNIQGGMNEAGLFYDFNILDMSGKEYIINNLHNKKSFPKGDHAILSHILANFEKVEEVVAFFEEYWFNIGFKGAQMHLADKYGHFAMIDPTGSIVLDDAPYQLSTNFSICAKEETYGCWRYPIAKDMLDNESIGFEAFRSICEKTAQHGNISTIYSNIQNLNTGDIWFYFALDYGHPYKTNIKALLANGRKSYLLRNLFPENPISKTYLEFERFGGKKAFDLFNSLKKLPENSTNSYLAAFVNNMVGNNFNLDVLPFLEEYLKTDPIGHWMTAARAISYFNNGDTDIAETIINDYKNKYPETSMDVEGILGKFQGKFPENANITIELNGYLSAKNVFVTGLPNGLYNFLIKKDGKWITKVNLPNGIYYYEFIVDGKKVLDNQTPIYTNYNRFSNDVSIAHRLGVNMTVEKYQKTIHVVVPDKNDEVYIAGNQPNLTNWNSVFRLNKVSDFEREITLDLHLPAVFKFTKGNWENEAILEGYPFDTDNQSYPPIVIDKTFNKNTFYIKNWK